MSFEVERFEWAADDRLELAGRWFDVRGRRFLRPTLDLQVDGDTRRLLATLEHKPWAAEEGDVWTAAFEWEGEVPEIDAVQLTVGPDLAVELEPPDTASGPRPRRKAVGRELAAARAEAKRLRRELERERAASGAEAVDLRERLAAAGGGGGGARREREAAHGQTEPGVSERQAGVGESVGGGGAGAAREGERDDVGAGQGGAGARGGAVREGGRDDVRAGESDAGPHGGAARQGGRGDEGAGESGARGRGGGGRAGGRPTRKPPAGAGTPRGRRRPKTGPPPPHPPFPPPPPASPAPPT